MMVIFEDVETEVILSEMVFDSVKEAKLFLEMIEEHGLDFDGAPYEHSVIFEPSAKAFIVCMEPMDGRKK